MLLSRFLRALALPLVFVTTFLFAQDIIPYTKTALDLNQEPTAGRVMRQVVRTEGGSYLNFNDRSIGGDVTTIFFFDGTDLRQIFTAPTLTDIAGVTDEGVFLMRNFNDSYLRPDGIFPLHVNVTANTIDTLLAEGLSGSVYYEHRGNVLYVSGNNSGIIAVHADGTTVSVEPPNDDPSCFNCYPSLRLWQPFDDRVIYTKADTTYVTNGTLAVPELFYAGTFEQFEYLGDQLLQFAYAGITAYDENTGQWISLTDQFAGFRERSIHHQRDGMLYFFAFTEATGVELFVTDGTVAGTTLALDFAPGSESGFWNSGQIVGDRLLVRGGSPDTRDNIYITDGTLEGTMLVYRNIDGLDNNSNFTAVEMGDGETIYLMLTKFRSSDFKWETKLIRFQPGVENPTAEVLLQNIANTGGYSALRGFINDRLILNWRVSNSLPYQILSYGAGGNTDSLHLFQSDGPITPLTQTEDHLYFRASILGSSLEGKAVYIINGLDQHFDFVFDYSNSTFPNEGEPMVIFEQDNGLFAFAYDEVTGTNIYRLNDDGSAEVTNVLRSTASSSIRWVEEAEGILLFGINSPEELEGFYRSDGTLARTERFSPWYYSTETTKTLGSWNGRTYIWMGGYNSENIIETELDPTTTRVLPSLWQSVPPSTTSETIYGNPVLLDGIIYLLRSARGTISPVRPGELELLAYNIDTEQASRVFKSLWTEFGWYRGNLKITVLNGSLYFTDRESTENENGSAQEYDPMTGNIRAITSAGSTLADPRLLSSRENMYVAGGADSVYVMNLVDSTLPIGISLPGAPTAVVDLPTGTIVQLEYGDVQVIDFTTGTMSSLLGESTADPVEQGLHLTPSGDSAVFFQRIDERSFTVYLTDGTQDGTAPLGTIAVKYPFLPNSELNIVTVLTFGNYLAVVVNGGAIFLIDPTDGRIQPVGDSVFVRNSEDVEVINDRLYFLDNAVSTGQELYYLTVDEQSLLRGITYLDENGNGQRDNGEAPLGGVKINDGSGGLAFSNLAGDFSFLARSGGTYTVTATPLRCYEPTGPSSYELTYSPDSTYTIAFGSRPVVADPGVRIDTDAATLRCGFTVPVWVTVTNNGCEALTGSLVVNVPVEGAFVSSDSLPVSVTEDSITFALNGLSVGSWMTVRLLITMPGEEMAGQPVSITSAVMASAAGGADLTDINIYTETLRCAIDPNDKQVFPRRAEPTGSNFTQIDETLKYMIRFQNTGNDTAFTVRIEDQLSGDLDWDTFKPLSGSHPFTASLSEDGLAIFLFENILLPDSTTNQIESNGFVTFEVMALADLEDFSSIDNTAGIFFDFNQPVITNTVHSTFVEQLDADNDGFNFYLECDDTNREISPDAEEIVGNSVDENCDGSLFPVSTRQELLGSLVVYPNPTDGLLELTYGGRIELIGEVYDATGRQLLDFRLRRTLSLDLSQLPSGPYLLRLRGTDGRANSMRWILVR